MKLRRGLYIYGEELDCMEEEMTEVVQGGAACLGPGPFRHIPRDSWNLRDTQIRMNPQWPIVAKYEKDRHETLLQILIHYLIRLDIYLTLRAGRKPAIGAVVGIPAGRWGYRRKDFGLGHYVRRQRATVYESLRSACMAVKNLLLWINQKIRSMIIVISRDGWCLAVFLLFSVCVSVAGIVIPLYCLVTYISDSSRSP